MHRKDSIADVHIQATADAQYTVELCSLDAARSKLRIRRPIRVIVTAEQGRSGSYEAQRDGHHHITVNPNLSPLQASRTIWHELTHAAQVERLGDDGFDVVYDRELRRIGLTDADLDVEQLSDEQLNLYYENRLEREAYKAEKQAFIYPICQPRESC